MKCGIVVDDWKLATFRKHLDAAGFEYQDGGAPRPNVTLLTVETDDLFRLRSVLRAAQDECRIKKGKSKWN